MSALSLVQTGFDAGCWRGRLRGPKGGSAPRLAVFKDGTEIDGLSLKATPGARNTWDVTVTLPNTALSEGTQVFVVTEPASETVLHRITIIAGTPATEDLRGELAALRAELDQLRAAFRAEMRARDQS